jgi:hypothetical protein
VRGVTAAIVAGVVIGVAYTLSPLAVVSLAAVVIAVRAAGRGLTPVERRWFFSVVTIAIVLRLMAIAILFLTADPSQPFSSFFGDEELYKFRSVWLRNVGQGIPISPADMIYTYDPVGRTGYMYLLAFLQALVGDAPYGLHVFHMMLYVAGVLALYRFMRSAYGSTVSMAGLIVLLYLPSMASWSISVLKEPMNVFMLAGELMCAVYVVRAPHWWQKGLAAAGVLAFALAMESLRTGGIFTAAVGTIGGVAMAFVLARGRRLATAMVLVPVAAVVLLSLTPVQERVMANLRAVAFHHAGHVMTPGYSYQLVDPGYYSNRVLLNQMPAEDAGRFVGKALWSFFAEPLPWRAESRALLLYVPEQFVWYVIALMLPIGVVAGLRRDALVTSMVTAHAAAAIVLVALTGGNVGTLIRHRSLALPYLVWLFALGAHASVQWFIERHHVKVERGLVNGDR